MNACRLLRRRAGGPAPRWVAPASARWTGLAIALAGAALLAGCTTVPSGAAAQRADLRRFEQVTAQQRRSDWCWAACAEMVLRYNGVHDVDQEALVARFKNDPKDQTANLAEIIQALAFDPRAKDGPSALDHWLAGGTFTVQPGQLAKGWLRAGKLKFATDDAVRDLAAGEPVVAGLRDYRGMPGHIVVVTGIEYFEKQARTTGLLDSLDQQIVKTTRAFAEYDPASDYEVVSVSIFDPAPDGGPEVLTAEQLDRHLDFWVSRRRAREIATAWDDTIQFQGGRSHR